MASRATHMDGVYTRTKMRGPLETAKRQRQKAHKCGMWERRQNSGWVIHSRKKKGKSKARERVART